MKSYHYDNRRTIVSRYIDWKSVLAVIASTSVNRNRSFYVTHRLYRSGYNENNLLFYISMVRLGRLVSFMLLIFDKIAFLTLLFPIFFINKFWIPRGKYVIQLLYDVEILIQMNYCIDERLVLDTNLQDLKTFDLDSKIIL